MKDIPISDKIPELDIAIKAAEEAGKVILEIYQKGFETVKKKDNSPVTEGDQRVMRLSKKFSHRQIM